MRCRSCSLPSRATCCARKGGGRTALGKGRYGRRVTAGYGVVRRVTEAPQSPSLAGPRWSRLIASPVPIRGLMGCPLTRGAGGGRPAGRSAHWLVVLWPKASKRCSMHWRVQVRRILTVCAAVLERSLTCRARGPLARVHCWMTPQKLAAHWGRDVPWLVACFIPGGVRPRCLVRSRPGCGGRAGSCAASRFWPGLPAHSVPGSRR